MDRDVYVIGVGIHRFGKHDISRRDMAYVAGIDALDVVTTRVVDRNESSA